MHNYQPSNLLTFIANLTGSIEFKNEIAFLREYQERRAEYLPFPSTIHPLLKISLHSMGIENLYSHQVQSYELTNAGRNLVISTGTSSGKSLCYQLPMIDGMLNMHGRTGLMIFPTKALTNDQLNSLNELIPTEVKDLVKYAVYDGDTPQRERAMIREKASIVLTNPDMLNLGILPHHPLWARFFENLEYVIIDEIHIYRGVFGSHIANLIRRLKRITGFYGSKPKFILTSATIRNPKFLAENLLEAEVDLIEKDGSPQGQKFYIFYNPPLINEELGIREGLLVSAGKFLAQLYKTHIQTLVFCRTRRFVELLLREVKNVQNIPENRIRGYRSGYLKSERRDIENGLKSGEIRIGIATNALELGVDIGGVDCVILPGYPGTIASFRQRAGRAGRKFNPALAVFIASMNPLDQYLARNPEYLMSRDPEEALINPDNPLILLEHLQCAAAELPLVESDHFGNLAPESLKPYLDYLESLGVLHHKGTRYYWVSDDYPTQHVSLRNTASNSILLRRVLNGQVEVIGEVDYNSGLWMVHPGAIYIHDGETYRVEELDLENNLASLTLCNEDYVTEPIISAEIDILSLDKSEEKVNFDLFCGRVKVRSIVKGFKRIKWSSREVIDTIELEMPETTLETVGVWIVLSDICVSRLRDAGMWGSDRNDYGPHWKETREFIRARDRYSCKVCGKHEVSAEHHVHHKVPFRLFTSLEKANAPENLVTLCADCHSLVESQVRVRSALSGLNHLLVSLAPLLVMSDTGDLGSFFEAGAKFAENKPAIIIYDNVPAGIGLAEGIYRRYCELLQKAQEIVTGCDCADGCPSCVGPALEGAYGGKIETLELVKYLLES
ncbi:MAG TPA: DEAD/DEAH box helicase [Anaerolineaceae bacterium]|nr:DEAD/DEAH box helicase [Anaerolineaceae bacterium]